jgi:hypothetical protein
VQKYESGFRVTDLLICTECQNPPSRQLRTLYNPF